MRTDRGRFAFEKGNEIEMLYRADEILKMLPLLDDQIADDLESESLDFKECSDEEKLREQAREMAVCLVNNGSGGTVVFGVRDKVKGRANAIVGIDFAPDLDRLKKQLYDSIDPKLLVQFEWLPVDSVRLLLMYAEPTLPSIYTTSSGMAKIRIGKDCVPLTGSVRQRALEKLGATDATADIVPISQPMLAVSPGAIELLRREMRNLDAPRDLLSYSDTQLCEKLGVLRDGALTFAGLLLVGKPESLKEYAPNHEWQYARMRSDTDYDVPPLRGNECLVVALDRIMLAIGQNNPITTVPTGLFHAEFPQYPTIALREAILNAFAHRSYREEGMVFIRHWRNRMEINSPGRFVIGVTPENILHHRPVTRNRYLVETVLLATRLVNRNNLGIPRIFKALLIEGKEPPVFGEIGLDVRVVFPGHAVDEALKAFLRFLTDRQGALLDVDDLLLLHFFRRRHEATWKDVREAYPYDDRQLHEKLAYLEYELLVVEHSGSNGNTIYRLTNRVSEILNERDVADRDRRLDREVLKRRVLSLLKQSPLRNQDVRAATELNQGQVKAMMKELQLEEQVHVRGRGSGAYWYFGKAVAL